MFRPCLIAVATVAAATILSACSRTDDTASRREATAPAPTSAQVFRWPESRAVKPSAAHPAAASWPPAEMQDPDPRMRRFALEQWARNPTESLDVVAAALVDPEESIRERAEQVFEEALARRR